MYFTVFLFLYMILSFGLFKERLKIPLWFRNSEAEVVYANIKEQAKQTNFLEQTSRSSLEISAPLLIRETMISAFRNLSSLISTEQAADDWQRKKIILSGVRSPSATARHSVGQGLIINSNLGVRAICDSAPLSTGSL